MFRATPGPRLLKYLVGQHILNGFAVSVGVFASGLVVGLFAGFEAGMAAGSGALCVSIADMPTPFAAKLRILPLAWIIAVASSLAIALAIGFPWLEALVVVTTGFVGGLLIALGRWAIPLSVLVMLAMVFTMGAPPADLAGRLDFEAMFALGGALYIPLALGLTRILDASGRRLTLAEVLREFAAYLRCVAGLYDADADQGAVFMRIVEQQGDLADHLQAARSLIIGSGDREDILHLVAGIVMLLEALDGMVSASADQAPLRLASARCDLAQLVSRHLRQWADELDDMSVSLVVGKRNLSLPDHSALLDQVAAEIVRIGSDPGSDPDLLRAARLTHARLVWVDSHLRRLPAVLTQQEPARKALEGVDPEKFFSPLRVSLPAIARELRWSSPIFRHAVRLTLALACGYALIHFVPGLRHGNWILLTIAVIMRASYSATRERRNERLFGTVVGCGVAGLLLASESSTALLLVQLVAIGMAHAFVRVDYRITSSAATVMALLGLHLIDPVTAAPVGARLVDTLVGVAICFFANRILPQWERHGAGAIGRGFLRRLSVYAEHSLRWDAPEEDYRLARKELIDSLAAVSESAERMRGDPAGQRSFWAQYGELIAAAYTTAAQIVTVRLLLRTRRDELEAAVSALLLDETRRAVQAELDLSQPPPLERILLPETVSTTGEMAASGAMLALRQRCEEVLREAARLRDIAATSWA